MILRLKSRTAPRRAAVAPPSPQIQRHLAAPQEYPPNHGPH